MGLAKVRAREPHCVANRAVVAGKFGAWGQIHGGDVIPERNPP